MADSAQSKMLCMILRPINETEKLVLNEVDGYRKALQMGENPALANENDFLIIAKSALILPVIFVRLPTF